MASLWNIYLMCLTFSVKKQDDDNYTAVLIEIE